VENLSHKINEYIDNLDDEGEIKAYGKIAAKVKNDRIITMISKRYKSFMDVHVKSKQWDSDVRYINCRNGVVDTQAGELLQHDRELYITKYADVDYEHGKVNNLYKGSIERLFMNDFQEVFAFEMLIGYMLSGTANLKTFPIIHGAKNSGKSNVFEIIHTVFGTDYCRAIDKNLLMKEWNKSSGASPELAELQGVRLIICSETNDRDYLNTDFIKKIVGSDTIKARALYKNPIEFRPIFVPVIYTNGKPGFEGSDDALVSRLKVIELLYPLTPKEQDPNFEQKVLKDKTGVFSYLIDCIIQFNIMGELPNPERWTNSLSEYTMDNNPYKEFANDALEIKKGDAEYTKEVLSSYEKWSFENGSKKIPSPKRFTMEIKKLGIKSTKRDGSIYLDVCIKEEWRNFNYKSYFKKQK